jgi:hypothetical protein
MTAVDLGVLAPRRMSRRGKITGLGPMLGVGVGVGVSGKF